MAVSSQGMQDHLGAKSANWLSCQPQFQFLTQSQNPGTRLVLLTLSGEVKTHVKDVCEVSVWNQLVKVLNWLKLLV